MSQTTSTQPTTKDLLVWKIIEISEKGAFLKLLLDGGKSKVYANLSTVQKSLMSRGVTE